MKWRFQKFFSSDIQSYLFSDNVNPLFKQNEDMSPCFTGQNIPGFFLVFW